MGAGLLAAQICFAAGVATLIVGAATALTSSNGVKRVGALGVLTLGAMLGASAFEPNADLLLSAIAIGAAHIAIGACIVVRMQEAYDGVEVSEIDAADARGDAADAQKQAGSEA